VRSWCRKSGGNYDLSGSGKSGRYTSSSDNEPIPEHHEPGYGSHGHGGWYDGWTPTLNPPPLPSQVENPARNPYIPGKTMRAIPVGPCRLTYSHLMGRIFCRLGVWIFGPTGSPPVYRILFMMMGKKRDRIIFMMMGNRGDEVGSSLLRAAYYTSD